MLKSKFVEVKWTRRTKKYYQNKGYIFTKYNDMFVASVKDLSNGCLSNVEIKCDYCDKEYKVTFHRYYNFNKIKKDKDACDNCKQLKVEEIMKDKLRDKSKSKQPKNIILNEFNIIHMVDIDDANKVGVYAILNLHNSKYYIGSTININTRMINHVKELRENKHHSIHLQRSWNKYGESNFVFGVLEYIDDADILVTREQYWLDKLKSYDDKYGYNICKKAYSCLGVRHGQRSQEVKDKISKANKGRIRKDVQGSNSPTAKLNEDIVSEIKIRIYNGEFVSGISKDYNIDISILYDIVNKVTWKHVLPELDLAKCKNKFTSAKLAEKDVSEIRQKLLKNVSINELAELYSVSSSTIKDIKKYRTWKHIKPLKEFG